MVRLPPLDELALNWWRVEPLLRRATQITGCYEPIDVLQLAMTGKVGIWVAGCGERIDAAIATEIKDYPRKRVLEIMFLGGRNMASWMQELIAVMDEHAKKCGCSHIASVARPGWERAWQAKRTGNVLLVRDLKDNVDA